MFWGFFQEEREKREIEYKKQFNSIVGKHKKSNHRRNFFFISNTEFSGDDFNGLKDEISQIAEEMDYFVENLPTKWIQLENALSILKDFDINIRSFKEVADLARQNFIEKEDELLEFLKYQHKIGNIIFFEDTRDYIILQPNWLVKCFRCLVCDDHHLKIDKIAGSTELNMLNSTGKLSEKLIIQLFKKEPHLKFDQYKDHLLKVLEKFDIIIKPNFESGDACLPSYYMPCMISEESDLVSIKKIFGVEEPQCSLTPWLVLEFNFLPLAYFNHILFDYITNYSICEVTKREPAIYCGKAVFWLNKEDKSNMLIVCFSQNAISLQIWKWERVMDNAYTDVIDKLLSKIEQLIKDQKISYKIKAKCNLGNYADARGRISIKKLNKSKKYRCQEHQVMHTTNDMKTTWFNAQINVSN